MEEPSDHERYAVLAMTGADRQKGPPRIIPLRTRYLRKA